MPHDLTTPALRAQWAIYAYVALQIVYSGWLIWYNSVYRDFLSNSSGDVELARLDLADTSLGYISIVFIVVLLTVYSINGRWIYLASSNAAHTVPSETRVRPGWAVGWYFVPIANFWMPFKAMREIWAASVGGGRLEVQVPSWFSAWWVAWVILTIADTFGSNLGTSAAASSEDYMNGNLFLAITGVLWVIPALLFLRIVREVTAHQGGAAQVFA